MAIIKGNCDFDLCMKGVNLVVSLLWKTFVIR